MLGLNLAYRCDAAEVRFIAGQMQERVIKLISFVDLQAVGCVFISDASSGQCDWFA